jgi:hypothetical protein
MMYGEIDAEPNPGADGRYTNTNPDNVGIGGNGIGGSRLCCDCHEQGANRGLRIDAAMSRCHLGPRFLRKSLGQ